MHLADALFPVIASLWHLSSWLSRKILSNWQLGLYLIVWRNKDFNLPFCTKKTSQLDWLIQRRRLPAPGIHPVAILCKWGSKSIVCHGHRTTEDTKTANRFGQGTLFVLERCLSIIIKSLLHFSWGNFENSVLASYTAVCKWQVVIKNSTYGFQFGVSLIPFTTHENKSEE